MLVFFGSHKKNSLIHYLGNKLNGLPLKVYCNFIYFDEKQLKGFSSTVLIVNMKL